MAQRRLAAKGRMQNADCDWVMATIQCNDISKVFRRVLRSRARKYGKALPTDSSRSAKMIESGPTFDIERLFEGRSPSTEKRLTSGCVSGSSISMRASGISIQH